MSAQKTLHENVSSFFANFFAKHQNNMACHNGCAYCCHTNISIFASEAREIERWFQSLPSQTQKNLRLQWNTSTPNGPDAAGIVHPPCPFLHSGSCTIYEARPTICRSQGLPLLVRETSPKTKETTLQVTCCPKNFLKEDSLPPQAEWLNLDRLNALLSIAAQQEKNVSDSLSSLQNGDGRVSLSLVRAHLLA